MTVGDFANADPAPAPLYAREVKATMPEAGLAPFFDAWRRRASGDEAMDRLADEIEPTLLAVLSGINMPGIDGCLSPTRRYGSGGELPAELGYRLAQGLVRDTH